MCAQFFCEIDQIRPLIRASLKQEGQPILGESKIIGVNFNETKRPVHSAFTMLSIIFLLVSTCLLTANAQLLLEAKRINIQPGYLHRILENIDEHETKLNTLMYAQFKYPDFASFSRGEFMVGADSNVSDRCLNDTRVFMESAQLNETWALQMLDAQGKPPSGILWGDRLWLGSFSECLNVTSNFSKTAHADMEQFSGKYCLIQIPLQANGTPVSPQDGLLGQAINTGLCVPSSCDSHDVTGLADRALSDLPVQTPISVVALCHHQPDLSTDGRGIAAIIVCSILGAFLLIGTAYDICFIQIPNYIRNDGIERTSENDNSDQSEKTALLKSKRSVLPIEDATLSAKPGALGKLLLSFSVYTNGSKILDTQQSSSSLTCLHGIRCLSMNWVMLGHTFSTTVLLSANFATFVPKLMKRWTMLAVLNGTFSVDSFFLLSGLLMAYFRFQEMDKPKGALNWAFFYFHRFWRLTPAYMLVLMVDICLLRYFIDGPIWSHLGLEQNYCEGTWWRNLLYISNFFPFQEMCMSWSWYLSNDMQFFMISPLVLIPLHRSKYFGGVVVLLLMIGSFVATGVVTSVYDIPPGGANVNAEITKSNDYTDMVYVKPYCRIGPYLVGIVIGYILYKTNRKIKINVLVVVLGWVLAAVCCLSVLYGMYGYYNTAPWTTEVSALYNAVSRTVWALGVGWVVFACCTGYGGFINTFLSWGAFIPLSRLTYCAYLIHILIMIVHAVGAKTPFHLTDLNMVYIYIANVVATYLIAFLISLAFEAPMMGLENVLFRRKKRT